MNKKILIVDDEADILKIMSMRLSKMGYDVILASNGLQAIDLAHQKEPDLILMDCQMPVLNGLEACKRIKADNQLKLIPLVLMTASLINEDVAKIIADDFIRKPFENGELTAKVQHFIGK